MNAPVRDQHEQRLAIVEQRLSEIDLVLLQLQVLEDIHRRVIMLEQRAGPDSFSTENLLSIDAEGKVK